LDSPGAPEEFDFLRWELPSPGSGGRQWLLRPEILESIYHVRRSTLIKARRTTVSSVNTSNDDDDDVMHEDANSWLQAAEVSLNAIEKWTRVKGKGCGYATIEDVNCA
jgi:hypothetical protein